MKAVITALLLTLSVLAHAAAPHSSEQIGNEVRVKLDNGTIIVGIIISAEDEESKNIETKYGTLLVPEDEIESIRYPYERNVLYEEWFIQSIEGKAKVTMLISIPKIDSDEIVLPLIESRYQPLITSVQTLDGENISFEQKDRGPIVLVSLQKDDVSKGLKQILVELTTSSAFHQSEDGTKTLKRRFTPNANGLAAIKIQTSKNLKIIHDNVEEGTEFSREEKLRRQQSWKFEASIESVIEN